MAGEASWAVVGAGGWGSDRAELFSKSNTRWRLAEVGKDTTALAAETAALELGMGDGLGRIKWRAP